MVRVQGYIVASLKERNARYLLAVPYHALPTRVISFHVALFMEVLVPVVPLWSYHWAFDGWRIYCDGSSIFWVIVSSNLFRDGREGRKPLAWHIAV